MNIIRSTGSRSGFFCCKSVSALLIAKLNEGETVHLSYANPRRLMEDTKLYDYLKAACGDSEHKLHGALVVFHEAGAKEPVEQQITREIRRCMTKEFENFFLRYQPIYDRAGGRPIAAEALLRWKNPQYGELTPIRYLAELSRTYRADVYVKAIESETAANALRGLPVRGVQGQYYADSVFYDEVLDHLEAQQD